MRYTLIFRVCNIARELTLTIATLSFVSASSQDFTVAYNNFKKTAQENYTTFKNARNKEYIKFLRDSWSWHEWKSPLPLPKEDFLFPPKPFHNEGIREFINIKPIEIVQIENSPQPNPFEPIREIPQSDEKWFSFNFYGLTCNVRLPERAKTSVVDCQPYNIASNWDLLCTESMNNTVRDCLEIRIKYNLCDWAYLQFLDKLGKEYCSNPNSATLLTAFLFSQSGYQMRLATDGFKLMLLYGSKHQIFDKGYFNIEGICFYPLGEPSQSISICNASFEGETPISLLIDKEQLLGAKMSENRVITIGDRDMRIISQVPQKLIEFYNTYPTSTIDRNPLTRWAMYANTPLAQKTKDVLYPSLNRHIIEGDELQAAGILLNWIQKGLIYEYDDKVWGHDRAFFSEETLYYPHCDCEDRSILFSRLIRDLLDLDVALIYYPGHLATAVCFNGDVEGDAMIINGRKFIICDPTYIGAPVGVQMPDLEYDKAQAILLSRNH